MFSKLSISRHHITLEAAGLVALVDISIVTMRTTLTATASPLDVLPSHPACINSNLLKKSTTENSRRLRIDRTGHFVTARVSMNPNPNPNRLVQSFYVAGVPATLLYLLGQILAIVVLALLAAIQDWRRSKDSEVWKGAPEEGGGDLLILPTQDCWVYLRGSMHYIKTVTVEERLRDQGTPSAPMSGNLISSLKSPKSAATFPVAITNNIAPSKATILLDSNPSHLPSSRDFSMFDTSSISGHISLESAGLVALADLSTVAVRTALTGTASWIDILVLAPGMHQQQSADEVNRGEFPQTGSLINGYVFRIENPATVSYLQRIGRTGCLVTARVEPKPTSNDSLEIPYFGGIDLSPQNQHFYIAGAPVALLYLLCPILTIVVFALVGFIKDWWALGVLGMLVLSRMINVFIIKRRVSDSENWKGTKETGEGDLLVVLSQDRWANGYGTEDRVESLAVGIATLLVYAAAALAGNASTVGSLLIALLLLCSVALLALCNSFTHRLQMYDCIVQEEKRLKRRYGGRLDMVKDLIVEEIEHSSGKGSQDDRESDLGEWAVSMGLIKHRQLEIILTEISGGLKPPSLSVSPDAKTR
ncbi:hypothetical protein DFS33DRAFT_1490957 [Desarmillaria ectypa]|nr:hypothetical protein DFS33DRAFT_1490957 [Desarmillaria ectypa]